MARELQADYVTGKTVYFLLRNSTGQIWNGSSFESYSTANLANYDIPATEQGTASGYYVANMPAVVADIYSVTAKEQAGGAPAESDNSVGDGQLFWDGTVVGVNVTTIVAAAVASIWAQAMTELASPPAVTGTALQALEWMFLLSRNKITQTSTQQLLRNDADSGTIGTSTVSDDGVTFTRGEFA